MGGNLRIATPRLFTIVLLFAFAGPAAAAEAPNQQLAISDYQLAIPVISQTISTDDAVAIALRNNPMVPARRAEAAAAAARVGMARAMTRPQVTTTTFATTGSMQGVISGSPTAGPTAVQLVPDTGQLDQNLMGMVPIYTGGGLQSRVRGAEALAGAATSDVRTSELDVALAARIAYRRAQLAGEFVKVYQKRVDEARERVRIAEVAFNEGRIAKYDLLRNQTDLADAEQSLNNAKRDVDVALVDLKRTLGVSQASSLTLSAEFASVPVVETLADAEARALADRPEVAAARARIASGEASVAVARSAYKPQVYGVAMADAAARSGGEMRSETGVTIGMTASLPLFDAGLRRSQVNESRSMLERMRAEERDIILAISQDVGTAYSELQAAARNVGLARVAVAQADEDYRVIKLRYEAGKSINVEVLDALASLTRAQTNYAQALYDNSIACDRLTRAMGAI